jgi:hypothetical protein
MFAKLYVSGFISVEMALGFLNVLLLWIFDLEGSVAFAFCSLDIIFSSLSIFPLVLHS